MARILLGTIALAFFMALPLAADVLGRQFDPLKRVREKMEQLQKKIDCAVNDTACTEEARQGGAEVEPSQPAPAPGTPPQPPGAVAHTPGGPAANVSPLNAAFTSTALAPMPTGPTAVFETVVSDDGAHAAGVAMKGSRFVVVVDGQEGPPFDQIRPSSSTGTPSPQGAAAFGRGGRRVAYIGVRAGATIAVVDGKEGPPFTSIVSSIKPWDADKTRTFHFSDDGSRVAYVGQIAGPGMPSGPMLQVVLDGTPGPRYARILDMLFAGKRHAYVAMTPDQKYVLVVDGKTQGAPFDGIEHLRGNDEGHIAFVGRRESSWSVVVDGVEGTAHEQPGEQCAILALSPTKARVAYAVIDQRTAAPGVRHVLHVDGKVVLSASGFQDIAFSPDATRLAAAYLVQDPGQAQRHKVMVDGWTSQDYGGLLVDTSTGQHRTTFLFSPDSKRFAFIASNGLSNFVVVDGEESAGYGTIRNFQFSPDGRRYAFEAYAGHGQGWVAVVDGTPGPKLSDLSRESLTFSPDGSRVAYAGTAGINQSTAVVDGQEQKVPVGAFQPRIARNAHAWRGVAKRHFVFSPDGKRLAYVNGLASSGKGAVMLDGQPQVPGVLFTQPTFTRDGRRFAHVVWVDQKWLLAVDGRSTPIDGDLYEVPRSLAFQDDGSLRYLAVKDNMLHRVVVTPNAGTN
jgi:hypothetical protein